MSTNSMYTGREDTDQKPDVCTRHQTWIGHVILRHDSLLEKVSEGKMEDKKTRGKPWKMLLDHLMNKNGNQR